LGAERLLEEVIRAERGRFGGQVARVRIREQDDRAGDTPLRLEAAQQIVRLRAQVEEAQQEPTLPHLGEGAIDRIRRDRFVAPLPEQLAQMMRYRRLRTCDEHESVLHLRRSRPW